MHNFDKWSLDTRLGPHSLHSTAKLQIENSYSATLKKIFNWIKLTLLYAGPCFIFLSTLTLC